MNARPLVIATLLAACSESQTAIVNNDLEDLADRVATTSEAVTVAGNGKPGDLAGCPGGARSLELIARVSPPDVDGAKLQAADIAMHGDFAIVGYNTAGDTFLGAVQVIQLRSGQAPVVTSEIVFPGTDVNSVAVHGNDVYLGESSLLLDETHPAAIERWQLEGGTHWGERSAVAVAPSFAVTRMLHDSHDGGTLYASVGARDGGLVALDPDTLAERGFVAYEDARAVAPGPDGTLAVLRGTPAAVAVVAPDTLTKVRDLPLGGATIPFSKSTLQTSGDIAMIAVGDGGFQIVNLETGAVLGSVANAAPAEGQTADEVVTNGASADGDLVFLASGAAGVRLACLPATIDKLDGAHAVTPTLIGTLGLADVGSVNGLAFHGKNLVVPAGSGGVVIVAIK